MATDGRLPRLALDFDDLIYPFMDQMVPFINARRGTDLTIDDFHTFDFDEVIGSTRLEAMELVDAFFSEPDDLPPPLEGAVRSIEVLGAHFELHIVTSRADATRGHTMRWISHHFPTHFADVHLCNSYTTDDRPTKRRKVEVCELLDAVGLVDDGLHNVAEVAASGRKGLLFGSFAWNRADTLPPGVVRVAAWDAVVEELLEGS